MDEEEITRLFKIRRTALEMVRDRGYLVHDSELTITREEFFEKFRSGDDNNVKREELAFCKTKINDASDQIYVFFPEEPKAGAKTLKTYVGRMHQENVFRALLVVQHSLTPSVKKTIADPEFCRKYQLEAFQDAELVVNIRRHEHVPEHKVLTAEEKKALLARYTLKETQLPQMKVYDPMAKYYGVKRGQVVKIIRDSDLLMADGVTKAGKSVTYRYVV